MPAVERVPPLPVAPGVSAADLVAAPRRRSLRDWFVDSVVVVVSLAVGLALFAAQAEIDQASDGLLGADIVLGTALCVALWWRRRAPVAIALAAAPVGVFSAMSGIAALVLLATVVVHRRAAVAGWVIALHTGAAVAFLWVRPDEATPLLVELVILVLLLGVVVGWGLVVRARRQLVASLRERATRAETEQQLRVEQARQLERTRIAREMHDALAHRISMVSVHAGALQHRPDAPRDAVARSAAVIRESAHEALQDLRDILGVLRAGVAEGDDPRPQPTLADVPRLVEECRDAGMRVVAGALPPGEPPAAVGRTAYRVVQEGLTNARKHAAGAEARVAVSGGRGAGLTVTVTTRPPVGRPAGPAVPGAGQGLAGLAERAALAGGRLDSGRTPSGDFRLCAELPWPATGPA